MSTWGGKWEEACKGGRIMLGCCRLHKPISNIKPAAPPPTFSLLSFVSFLPTIVCRGTTTHNWHFWPSTIINIYYRSLHTCSCILSFFLASVLSPSFPYPTLPYRPQSCRRPTPTSTRKHPSTKYHGLNSSKPRRLNTRKKL